MHKNFANPNKSVNFVVSKINKVFNQMNQQQLLHGASELLYNWLCANWRQELSDDGETVDADGLTLKSKTYEFNFYDTKFSLDIRTYYAEEGGYRHFDGETVRCASATIGEIIANPIGDDENQITINGALIEDDFNDISL